MIRLRRTGGTVELWSQGEDRYEVRAPGRSQLVSGFDAARDELARLASELVADAPRAADADRVARLHERAEEVHLHAARLHDDAASYWDTRGYHQAAAREREIAQDRREAAQRERSGHVAARDERAGTREMRPRP